jgi:GWxTD domain-containing protein
MSTGTLFITPSSTRVRQSLTFIYLLLSLTACAVMGRLRPIPREASLWTALERLADRSENRAWKAAVTIGPDSIEAFLDRFWARRDPTPGTPANEFRDRLLARFEEGSRRFTPVGQDRPDDRIVPYTLFGEPERMVDLKREYPRPRYQDWEYLAPAVESADTNKEAEERPGFWVSLSQTPDGRFHLERDLRLGRGVPPPLSAVEAAELGRVLGSRSSAPGNDVLAVWRLGIDPGPEGLAELLGHLDIRDTVLQQSIRQAILPLRVRADPGGARSLLWEPGSPVPRPGDVPDVSPPEPSTLEADPFSRIGELLLVYDPAARLPVDTVEELRGKGAQADSLLQSSSWLSSEESERIFTGPLGQARALLESGDSQGAHKLLDPLLDKEYAGNPEAWHLDAMALVDSGEPGGRSLADLRIRKALRLDPGNLRYHLTLARIQYQRTYYGYTLNELENLLEELPFLADAVALKAALHLEAFWAFGLRAGGATTPLYEKKMTGGEFLDLSLELLDRALLLDPDHPLATWWLGHHHIRRKDWTAAIPAMSYLIKVDAHRAEALLGRGLAFQNLGLLEQAAADYEAGLALLPKDIRPLADAPAWVLPPVSGGVGTPHKPDLPGWFRLRAEVVPGAAAGEPSAESCEAFWKSRDPLFTTPSNERKLEQYRRFAHVTWNYPRPDLGLRGWETVKGQVYLRYGEPLAAYDAVTERMWRRITGEISVETEEGRIEYPRLRQDLRGVPLFEPAGATWTYPGFEVEFKAGLVTGLIWLVRPAEYQKLMDRRPSLESVVGFREIRPLTADWYSFRGRDNRPEFIPVVDAGLLRTISPGEVSAVPSEYEVHLLLLDEEWEILRHDVARLAGDTPNRRFQGMWVGPALLADRQPSGEQPLFTSIEVLFPGKGPGYVSRDTLRSGTAGEPALSSLVLATDVASREQARRWPADACLMRGDRALVPLHSGAYVPGMPLRLYFEIYDLSKDPYGATDYQMDLTVTTLGGPPSLLPEIEAFLGRLLGRQEKEDSVRLSFACSDIRTQAEHEFQLVFPQGGRVGHYQVTVSVRDNLTGAVSERSVRLGTPR